MGRGTEFSESLKENLAQGTIEILDMGGSLEDAKTIQDDLMASTKSQIGKIIAAAIE